MARNPGLTSSRGRVARPSAAQPPAAKSPAAKGAAAATPDAPKKPFNPAQFVNEVRAEARKITWTSRQETWITSVMVFIMVLATAAFFVLVDSGIGFLMKQLLALAS
jgi:preprotein translocase subunit SecE